MSDNLATIRTFQASADYADYASRWHQNQGDTQTAAQFIRRRDRLVTEVDILWNQLFDTWAANAGDLTASAKAANKDLEKEIKQMEKSVQNARHAVQALALLDRLIDLAKDVIP